MLEIIVVWNLCKKMGGMMRSKGYERPFWFQCFVPMFWLGGEIAGAIAYGIFRAVHGQDEVKVDAFCYLVAMAGAVLAATLLFVIARSFPEQDHPPCSLSEPMIRVQTWISSSAGSTIRDADGWPR